MSVTDSDPVTNEEMLRIRARFMPSAYLLHHPIVAESASGPWLTDASGRRYLDFAGGIAVVNVGHRDGHVVDAVRDQLTRLIHSGPVTGNRPSIELARRISLLVGADRELQTLFVNSGAEATENAIKVARHATGRTYVVGFDRAFHGRTYLSTSVAGQGLGYRATQAPEVLHAPYPDPLRPPEGVSVDALVGHSINTLDALVDDAGVRDQVAAVIVEPVLGEGGYVVPPAGFLRALSDWCRANGALLIVDEIQTGFGRTGKMFGFQHDDIAPDIVTLGKSIGDGLPLAAIVAPREIWDRVAPGDIGGTYAGNPLACAAGLAVLDVFAATDLVARANEIGARLRSQLEEIADHPKVGEIRGLGAMTAIEFVTDTVSLEPDKGAALAVVTGARERGLLVIKTGTWSSGVRLIPPLIIDDATVDDAARIMIAAVMAVPT